MSETSETMRYAGHTGPCVWGPGGYACEECRTFGPHPMLRDTLPSAPCDAPETELEVIVSAPEPRRLTLPTDSEARKAVPIFSGVMRYFPAALAEVAKVSKAGNDKHNPGQPLHWARGKSMDHFDCVVRHMIDAADLDALIDRGCAAEAYVLQEQISEQAALAWRALADLQLLCERAGAPKAPGAK